MTPDDRQAEKLAAILAAVQTDPGNRGLARVPGDNLFTATAGDFEKACKRIADSPADTGIALMTGFYIPTATPPASETDGPLGCVQLAASLSHLGFRTFIYTDVTAKVALRAGLSACGMFCSNHPNDPKKTDDERWRCIVQTIPGASHPMEVFVALDWMGAVRGYKIEHVVSVERVGPSHKDGRCYSMRGLDITDRTNPMHHLMDECVRQRDIHTIGIGDGGNEIGMGRVQWATIARNIPNGDKIACRVPTDHLIVAGVSNWGAYALAAGVFVLRRVTPPPDLFDPETELRILEVMVKEGPLVDGVTGKQTATVDGLTWGEYVKPLIQIRDILNS